MTLASRPIGARNTTGWAGTQAPARRRPWRREPTRTRRALPVINDTHRVPIKAAKSDPETRESDMIRPLNCAPAGTRRTDCNGRRLRKRNHTWQGSTLMSIGPDMSLLCSTSRYRTSSERGRRHPRANPRSRNLPAPQQPARQDLGPEGEPKKDHTSSMWARRPEPTSPERGLGVPVGIMGVAADTLRGTSWLPGLHQRPLMGGHVAPGYPRARRVLRAVSMLWNDTPFSLCGERNVTVTYLGTLLTKLGT
jgi:hypothetical protein